MNKFNCGTLKAYDAPCGEPSNIKPFITRERLMDLIASYHSDKTLIRLYDALSKRSIRMPIKYVINASGFSPLVDDPEYLHIEKMIKEYQERAYPELFSQSSPAGSHH